MSNFDSGDNDWSKFSLICFKFLKFVNFRNLSRLFKLYIQNKYEKPKINLVFAKKSQSKIFQIFFENFWNFS